MDSRKEVEIHYEEEFKEKILGIQEKVREQSQKMEELIKGNEENFREKLSNCDVTLQEFLEQQRKELDDALANKDSWLKINLKQ